MSYDAFLRAIIDRPDDDTPRLVYADWLDETGDPARAEFIRVQCELATLPEDDPRRPGLEDREHELLDTYEPDWLTADGSRFAKCVFRRGFIEHIASGRSSLLAVSHRFFELHPVTDWTVDAEGRGFSALDDAVFGVNQFRDWAARLYAVSFAHTGWRTTDLEPVLASGLFPRLESLDLSHNPGLSGLAGVVRRFPSRLNLRHLAFGGRSGPNFGWVDAENETLDTVAFVEAMSDAPLERIAAFDCGLTGEGLRLLLAAPFAPRLTDLDISDNRIAPDAWRAFRDASRGLRLKRFDASGTDLGAISLDPILNSLALEHLESLEINRCGSARPNIEAVARSRFWTQATEFRAHGNILPALHFAPLCEATGPPALRRLDLADNYLRTGGVQLLCNAPWAGSLTWLALSRNYLDDTSLTILADGGRFTKLRALHLAHNNLDLDRSNGEVITDTGVHRLAGTPSLANLRVLSLSFTGVTDRSVGVLMNAPHWRLAGLGLDGCDLSADAVRTLAESPRLARLQWLSLAANPRLSGDALRPLAESPYLSRMCELDVGGVYADERTLSALWERLGARLKF